MAQQLDQIHPPASAAVTMAYFVDLAARLQAGEAPQPFRGELEYFCKDGSTVWTEVEVIPHVGPDGQVIEILGVTRDISKRKRAVAEVLRLKDELEDRVRQRTAQLEEAHRELEAFIYSAAHDLRAPLRAIDGFSQLVVEDAGDKLSGEEAEHLQRVRGAAQHMGRLIDRLVVLARSAGEEVQLQSVDVTALATAILDDLHLGDRGRRVDTAVTQGLEAEADPTLLRAVLTTLLENAWKFTGGREVTRIEVGAQDVGGELVFFVRDNGAGFPPAAAQRIFGAFQRAHTAEEFPGDGLGLTVARRLVTKQGGRLWAEAGPGEGAAFFFTLPGRDAIPPGTASQLSSTQ
jgi:light-regulated signal transduction histidine kinase (bacteriophytochrome)